LEGGFNNLEIGIRTMVLDKVMTWRETSEYTTVLNTLMAEIVEALRIAPLSFERKASIEQKMQSKISTCLLGLMDDDDTIIDQLFKRGKLDIFAGLIDNAEFPEPVNWISAIRCAQDWLGYVRIVHWPLSIDSSSELYLR
jgi:hypothetical protein